jgi:hypothetical protein
MKQFFKIFFTEKGEVNYLYFSFFFLFILLLSALHYQEQPLVGFPLYFLLYAVAQSFLEVFLFILIASLLKRWGPNWLFLFFISCSFLLLLFHLTDFFMVRLMDASGKHVLKFFFGSGIIHLAAGLQAMNLSWAMVAILLLSLVAVPVLGLSLYWITYKMTYKKPLKLSLNQIGLGIGIIGVALLLLDIVAHPFLNHPIHSRYTKTLPFGSTFLSPEKSYFSLENPITPFRNEEELHKQMPTLAIEHKPNIYFFVIETFRKDFLPICPHLTAFGRENIELEYSFSNANSTQLSWLALFHSNIPFHWAKMRAQWKQGSLPLSILKNLGYEVEIYSSADLRFFQMDKLLFGHHGEAIDTIHTFDRNLSPWERDSLAIQSLSTHLKKEGHAYIIFLDSPHSEYSFPNEEPHKYEPISKEIDYLTIRPKSEELELIKNRYRNSLHYVDQLLATFFRTLKEKNLYDDALISITGDHGEEFFEEGALFHATHLNHYQTSVPILMKFPSKDWVPQTNEATHIDLFPSILHYLTKQSDFTHLFDGRSIFSIDRPALRIAVMQNGPKSPIEFIVEKADMAMRARYIAPSKLEMVDLKGSFDPNLLR